MIVDFNLLKPSASMEVARLAGQLKKEGRKIYPLGIGDTHFSPPKSILNKLENLPAEFSHYTNSEGINEVRIQISKLYKNYDESNVLLVPGLKQGLYYALVSLQKSILCTIEPAWLGYEATAILAGYEAISVDMQSINWLEQLSLSVFEVIVICSPNNPNGKIFTEIEMNAIVSAAEKNNAWIITDFIYDRYDYDLQNHRYDTLWSYNKLIIGNGFSKSHAITGFRVGYLISKDKSIINKINILQQNLATCVPSIAQYALLDLEDADSEVNENVKYYHQNCKVVLNYFPEWKEFYPQGGFYFFIDLGIYDIKDGQTFCQNLLRDTGIALVPGQAYGKNYERYVRLSFSLDREVLIEALKILKNYLQNEKN